MSNDTDRLLRYIYGELDNEEDFESELSRRHDLFEDWFAFHEVKKQLDAQAPAQPDPSVVDQIVDQARREARPTTPEPSSLLQQGDGVPQGSADSWLTVASPPSAEKKQNANASSRRHGRTPRSRTSRAPTETSDGSTHIMQWGMAMMLVLVLVLSGGTESATNHEALAEATASAPATDLPAWDAPDRRAAIHVQATGLYERMTSDATLPTTASRMTP